MNPSSITLVRQPIVDAGQELLGFELQLHAEPFAPATQAQPTAATATIVANAFSEIGLEQVLGGGMGFLEVGADFLCSELVEVLPARRIVLEVREDTLADETARARAWDLRRRGYRLAIAGFAGTMPGFEPLLALIDMVKIDFERFNPRHLPELLEAAKMHGACVIAENVDTPERFRRAEERGAAWFQGFHFAVPEIITARRAKPARLALLRLLALILHDCETQEIEEGFKHHPALAVNLLRLVNSAAFGRRENVTSMRHAVVLLGRRQLRVWLQLLLYSADRDNRALASPLLQLAAARGKLMEQLASRPGATQKILADLAFMTGILSLVDALFGMPMDEVLGELGVPPPVTAALLRREGELGALLVLTERLERGDDSGVAESLRQAPVGINRGDLLALQLAAYRWAGEIAEAA